MCITFCVMFQILHPLMCDQCKYSKILTCLLLQVTLHCIVRTVLVLMFSIKLLLVCLRAHCSMLLNVFWVNTDIKIAFVAFGCRVLNAFVINILKVPGRNYSLEIGYTYKLSVPTSGPCWNRILQ
jgi:hypothetical protein